MLTRATEALPEHFEGSSRLAALPQSQTLAALVLAAWQIGLSVARSLVEQQLNARAQQPTAWGMCPVCGRRLQSKGFASRQMLTLVGRVQWRRRVGRCPKGCVGSQVIPFDAVLGLDAYQQTDAFGVFVGALRALRVGGLVAVSTEWDSSERG